MTRTLVLTVQFLDPLPQFHGRGDQGLPEWPPSPLRLFQALVNAAAAFESGTDWQSSTLALFSFLENQLPVIQAPVPLENRVPRRTYVPNNSDDLVTASWARGNSESHLGESRAEKDVCPTRLIGDTLNYAFELPSDPGFDLPSIRKISRSVTHLGWGTDLVRVEAKWVSTPWQERPDQETWVPAQKDWGVSLRAPIPGTLKSLQERHRLFLSRLNGGIFRPVPPNAAFRLVPYQKAREPLGCPFIGFSLQKPDGSGFRPFDPVRHSARLASMIRHGLAGAARESGWPESRINTIIHGHNPEGTQPLASSRDNPRLAVLPIPTLESRPNGSRVLGFTRRVLITDPFGVQAEMIPWLRQVLSGREILDEATQKPVAILIPLSPQDRQVAPYLGPGPVWTTATPIVLPGQFDRSVSKCEKLIRKAMIQAGLNEELVKNAEVAFRPVGWIPGADLADRYRAPAKLHNPKIHLRIRWRSPDGQPIPFKGPLALGAGRFRGMGVFLTDPD